MRELQDIYRKVDTLNFLCLVATRLLGNGDLKALVPLLGGYRSVDGHPRIAAAAIALRNLRLMGLEPGTERTIGIRVSKYNQYHTRRRLGQLDQAEDLGIDQRFQIDQNLIAQPLWGAIEPADVASAIDLLRRPMPLRAPDSLLAMEPDREAEIRTRASAGMEYESVVDATRIHAPDPPHHDLARRPRPPGLILWRELANIARDLDREDTAGGRRPAGAPGWESRLLNEQGDAKLHIMGPRSDLKGLAPVDGIDLTGLKHLIGLPGSGKSTVLLLLAVLLARRGHRCAFMFPSIEVATSFADTAAQYETTVGILYGQAPGTRRKHLAKFARSMAHQNGGLGETRPSGPLYPSTCALEAFVPLQDEPFPQDEPPCLSLRQKPAGQKRQRRVFCNLASVCGRLEAPRRLTSASIWAGHISSADVQLPTLFAPARITYLELLSRSFDLVVVDEADGAQSLLDENGVAKLDLFGSESSLLSKMLDVRGRLADGRNEMLASPARADDLAEASTLEQHNIRLTHLIQSLDVVPQEQYQNRLITTATLFSDLYPADRTANRAEYEAQSRRQYFIERVFTESIRRVAFPQLMEQDDWEPALDLGLAAAALGKSTSEVIDFSKDLSLQIANWFRESEVARYAIDAEQVAIRVRHFLPPGPTAIDAYWSWVLNLALQVGAVVFIYLNLSGRLRAWAAEGVWHDDQIFQAALSGDTRAVLPESLFGRFSAVRYSVEDRKRVHLQYLTFSSTPRALLYHLHDLHAVEDVLGPAVLLTSATSYLEDSPSFHIAVGPHYLLRRPNAGSAWSRSRYALLPLEHPFELGQMLAFSGAPFHLRDAHLRWMADRMIHGGDLSIFKTALANNDFRDGVQRRVGWVVNSYEQALMLMEHLSKQHHDIAARTRVVTNEARPSSRSERYVSTSEVEALGSDDGWDLLIFPMGAIGRGMNIVFQDGVRKNEAMIGSLFFLTRPHPKMDSTQFLEGLVASASMKFDRTSVPASASLADLGRAYNEARRALTGSISTLLRSPLMLNRLGPLARNFVADQMVAILQTIGRAMRNDCPAFVYFVDSAWAPLSARGENDSAKSSMLMMMREILQDLIQHEDPVARDIYSELYLPFLDPLLRIDNLNTGDAK